jgi:CHAD domain-containing protein
MGILQIRTLVVGVHPLTNLDANGQRSARGPRDGFHVKQAVERELKFEAVSSVALPDLRDIVGGTQRLPQQRLFTTYYDTTDGRLRERGLTIRHRTIDDQAPGTWTLKVPHNSQSSGVEREELSWEGHRDDVPGGALEMVRGLVRREPLRSVISLETLRQRLILQDETGCPLAELDDDAVLVAGGPRDGWRFRQVELELHDPSSSRVHAIAARLEHAGLMSEETPKLAKALGIRPHVAPRRRLGRKATLGDLVRATLSDGLDRLLDHDWRLRGSVAPDEHDVHQARVATRRLRSDLKTFGVVLDPVWLSHMRDDLKWVGAHLGEVRDLDVLAATVQQASKELAEDLLHQRRMAASRLANVLNSGRYLRMLDRLHAASRTPPFLDTPGTIHSSDPATDVVPALVARRWKALRRQVNKGGHHPSDRQLHQTRIKAKHLRYAAEGVTPVFGTPAARVASAAERIQTVLGRHHDAVEAKAWLEESAERISPSCAFEAGRLANRQEALASEHQRRWRHSWKELAHRSPRNWMK